MGQKMIDTHTHMKKWDKETRKYVEKSGVSQFWVMEVSTRKVYSNRRHAKGDVISKAAKDMPGTIIPFAMIRWTQSPEQVEKYFEQGFVGLKAICPPKSYDHHSYYPIYEKANQLGMPILFHTGIIAHIKYDEIDMSKNSNTPTLMQPACLGAISAAFPEMILIGGHMGYPYMEQTHHNLYYYNNIYHDLCGYHPWEWLLKNMDSSSCHYIEGGRKLFCEKILMATDQLIGDEGSHRNGMILREFWKYFLEVVGRYYLWGTYKDKILYGNAESIMKKTLEKQKKYRK